MPKLCNLRPYRNRRQWLKCQTNPTGCRGFSRKLAPGLQQGRSTTRVAAQMPIKTGWMESMLLEQIQTRGAAQRDGSFNFQLREMKRMSSLNIFQGLCHHLSMIRVNQSLLHLLTFGHGRLRQGIGAAQPPPRRLFWRCPFLLR